jgi:hypothetical protein
MNKLDGSKQDSAKHDVTTNKKEISNEIQRIFDNNELEDLKSFMSKRHCLNNFNISLMYIFHIVQSAGILTTTVAAGYNQVYLIWIGVALNVLASLINVFERNNNTMLKKLMIDIKKIKDGNYIGETALIEPDSDKTASQKELDKLNIINASQLEIEEKINV